MKYLIIFLVLPFLMFSQKKGVSPVETKTQQTTSGTTYAVVVGISDYQDNEIPDLRFAHRDAEAFALWLQSPAGGGLKGDQLQMLINEKATAGRVAEALDALIERVKQNDKVFIYFSGHGDVERKTFSQPGFLLCWDAPARVYMGGGTYSLSYLQEIITTLSLHNKAKVTVIADACRAGKLAGSQVGGPQMTSANLMRQQTNEIKILSCQPEEYSIEGSQWGGGRGVFSYHLMDGLYGLADRNKDGVITLGELDRYLEDHVSAEAAPISQVPVLMGNKTDGIAITHEKTLANLTRIKSSEKAHLAPTDNRGQEDEVLAKVDSSVRQIYQAFKLAMQEKRFLTPVENSAENFYVQLQQVKDLAPLRGMMKRNFAAALQDEAQRYFNALMDEEVWLGYYGIEGKKSKFNTYPLFLKKAAELLGSNHYMYKPLLERMHIMEAYLAQLNNLNDKMIENLHSSIQLNPHSAIAFNMLSKAFLIQSTQEDSVIQYAIKSLEQAPNWYSPLATLSNFHRDSVRTQYILNVLENNKFIDTNLHVADKYKAACLYKDFVLDNGKFNLAESLYLKIVSIEPEYLRGYRQLALMYMKMGRYQDAEKMYLNDTTNLSMLDGLTEVYSKRGETYNLLKNLEICKKMVGLDSTSFLSWNNLGWTYLFLKRYDDCTRAFDVAFSLDTFSCILLNGMAQLYSATSQYSKAELFYKKAIKMDHINSSYWIQLGYLYIKMKKYEDAEQVFLKKT